VQIFFVGTFACAGKRQRPLELLGGEKSADALKVLRAFLKRFLPLSATPSRARYQLFEIAPGRAKGFFCYTVTSIMRKNVS
jgi:hypothetical protein